MQDRHRRDRKEPLVGAIIAGIVHPARRSGLSVIAGGVESAAQADVLSETGCDFLQGYFFSRPVGADDIVLLAREGAICDRQRDFFCRI